MTSTLTAPAPSVAPAAPHRIWNVVRMHVANPFPTLVMPWLVTLAIFGLNLAIELMVVRAAGGVDNLDENAFQYNGGISWIAIFMLITAVQAMNLTFRFALGFSVTRRDFYLGSSLYFAMLSVLYATGITVMAAVERATDGWGMHAAFFAPWGLVNQPLAAVWAVFVLGLLLFFFLGVAAATLWVRWKAYGLYAFFLTLAVIVVGFGWLVTATDNWSAVWDYLSGHSAVQLAAGTLPFTLICAVAGFLFLRRATPRA
ncbi:ABC transporter permease [Demequina aurantiaca]|uniref:ABC transporter permease n=1 Tax=Demequina aurantiaca TaxID=676200 RepID=UPI000B2039C9|nr:ABC transporter permease [Demequina aurantiaca]